MMDEPIDHVLRSLPPWDSSEITECGRDVVNGRILTRDEFVAKVKREGKQRSAMTTCMTCWSTATRYRPWNVCPSDTMARWLGPTFGATAKHDDELRAIAALIEAHRDEYDGFLLGLQDAPDLTARRQQAAKLARTDPHLRRL